jgi:hypothetical protein
MKTKIQQMTARRVVVAAALVMMAAAGIVQAKSMYVVAKIINFDAPIPVHVYDIGPDGLLTYQTEFGAPFIGSGMVGICMDSDTGYLFSTYEDSGFILVTTAATLEKRAVLNISGARNLAGTVYDHQKKLLYCSEMGNETLHVLTWNSLTGKVTPVVGSPFALKGASIYGIALDEYSDLLYVASPSQGIAVYSTDDWSLVRTELAEAIAISIAVDPERDYLYYGGGYAENFNLTRRNISTWAKKEVLVDPNARHGAGGRSRHRTGLHHHRARESARRQGSDGLHPRAGAAPDDRRHRAPDGLGHPLPQHHVQSVAPGQDGQEPVGGQSQRRRALLRCDRRPGDLYDHV